jgi:hypothetical protein
LGGLKPHRKIEKRKKESEKEKKTNYKSVQFVRHCAIRLSVNGNKFASRKKKVDNLGLVCLIART